MAMSKEEQIAVHDKVIESWTKGGEILHIWRSYEYGYLVSYYVTLFVNDGTIMIDFARIFGENPSAPSIDQRCDMRMTDHQLSKIDYTQKHKTGGSD